MMKVSEFINGLGLSAKSLAKAALQSRRCKIPFAARTNPLIVLANGPSLNRTMAESLDTLRRHDTMSVNFAPVTEAFAEIKPRYHVIADPVFFADNAAENVSDMYRSLSQVDWVMSLFVPRKCVRKIPEAVCRNSRINVIPFNFVGAEGLPGVERMLYNARLAMPRPRNVLIPALMCGMWLGYTDIYIAGADHSWMQTISVDDQNHVISVQPHFYKDDEREQKRVDDVYRDYRLHQIVHSFYVAFKSYHTLRRYADRKGIRIYNSTPGSYIDAFERAPLPTLSNS